MTTSNNAPEVSAPKKIRSSKSARRRMARLAAVQVLYSQTITGEPIQGTLAKHDQHFSGQELEGEHYVSPDTDLLQALVSEVSKAAAGLDEQLAAVLQGADKLGRMESLLLIILRCGLYELQNMRETDTGIILNDYVTMTQNFFTDTEAKLVNAVLDKLAKSVR